MAATVIELPTLNAAEPVEPAEAPAAIESRSPFDWRAVWIWILCGSLVLYLGIDGGGYDLVVRNDAGVVVWWILLLGAGFGLLPSARLSGSGKVAVGLFGGFVLWSAIASTWSLSSERSLQEVSRLACYFGVLLLALTTYGDRRRGLTHAVGAVASALTIIIALALLSRLRPGLLHGAEGSTALAEGRLNWPLDYWNGLAAVVSLAVPLLLSIAGSARRTALRAVAAAALPMAALCGYLTLSRGGAIATGVAVVAFIALAPERIPKLATVLVSGLGSAVLIIDVSHRSALEHGLASAAARQQGAAMTVVVIAVCVLSALAQIVIVSAERLAGARGALRVRRSHAQGLFVASLLIAILALIALHAPMRLTHEWQQFKGPNTASLSQTGLARYSTVSGEGRYDFWKAAVDAMPGHWLGGWGPGTFQLLWLPRATFPAYVVNAHSLYFETLAEVGVVGLLLLAAFFLMLLAAGLHRVVTSRVQGRTQAAAVVAACLAFLVSASVDWMWQLPVLPVALLLLGAGVMAPANRSKADTGDLREESPRPAVKRWTVRAGLVVAAVACLLAIGVPLASTDAVRHSQAAARSGNASLALADARTALRIEPGATSAALQAALVLEVQHQYGAALTYAADATRDEPEDWQTWLVRSRIEAEAGHPALAVASFRRARALNPQSAIFKA